jgi:quercetin dioxygenase-like cupin family protein
MIKHLFALAAILAAGTALGEERQAAAPYHFVPHGQGKIFDLGDEIDEVKLSATLTEGRYTIQDEHWHPGYDIFRHYHKEHAEVFYLISGQLEWTVGKETRRLGAGDLLYIPPNTIHSVHVVGDKDAHLLFIVQPGGYEHSAEEEYRYSKEEREKPEIRKKLNEQADIYPVD